MASVNWDAFARLPGAADVNFEKLCRSLVRRHYGQFGSFQGLANQAGVEFHLKLRTSCALGDPPRWFGWQCKWYDIPNGVKIGASRRSKITESLDKTVNHLPGLTDWALWTKQTLTKADQAWFYELSSRYPDFNLALLTSDDIESLLTGVAANLREAYFGELVVTPRMLADQQKISAKPFQSRYQAEVHHVVPTEDALLRCLLDDAAWSRLGTLADRMESCASEIRPNAAELPNGMMCELEGLLAQSSIAVDLLRLVHGAIAVGDAAAIREYAGSGINQSDRHRRTVARLRSARSSCALLATNLLADIHAAEQEIAEVRDLMDVRLVGVLAPAGAGKSELSLRITTPTEQRIGGVVLFGKNLHAGHDLDQLVRSFKISGKPTQSFEEFVEAIDAAGQRAGLRIPVVIDGLNEAEDPRDWKDALSRADEVLKQFPHVLLVVTLRDEFREDCLPNETPAYAMSGFEDNPRLAIDRYFEHYKIDATDEDLPLEFLQHPLTLRIYCEVANPDRKHPVGVEALPRSMSALFSEYFRRLVSRIAHQSPRSRRLHQHEVQEALLKLGELMWEQNRRVIEQSSARKAINDADLWSDSLLRAFESEGVLVRVTDSAGRFGVAFTYDLMAGHVIAEHLLRHKDVDSWFTDSGNVSKFSPSSDSSHTLAPDIFGALAGLFPARRHGRQFWEVLPASEVNRALILAAKGDPANISRATVDRFAQQMIASIQFAQSAYPLLRVTRAARAHPFDSDFLDRVLRQMSNGARDLSWSEWLRKSEKARRADVIDLDKRWSQTDIDHREVARARWVMWMLTTTSRYLRDLATKALHSFALSATNEFYALALGSSAVSDPYVPERMFAAGYGAALSTWSDPSNEVARTTLPPVAKAIFRSYFAKDAATPTRHALLRQYCLGIIGLARRIDPTCLSDTDVLLLESPFGHLPSPFDKLPRFGAKRIKSADDAAISMDFGNYTLGRLVDDRSNYDFKHPEYVQTRKLIVKRMLQLGYDPEAFRESERALWSSSSRHDDEGAKVDRYGKKYGWIAYFEMWGLRSDLSQIADWRSYERTTDADIDPSFPGPAKYWDPKLPSLFDTAPKDMAEWIANGPAPDYRSLLEPTVVDGEDGGWVLLEGFLEETARTDYRSVFSFMRGLLVETDRVGALQRLFHGMDYPGNDAIAGAPEHHYKYAGEMPIAAPPGVPVSAHREPEVVGNRWKGIRIPVEVPVNVYSWESYHSKLNTESGAFFPSPAICESIGLGFRPHQWDLFDTSGVGSLSRRIHSADDRVKGRLAYLRADLLDRYLAANNLSVVWLIWGERGQHYRAPSAFDSGLERIYEGHKHIHKFSDLRGGAGTNVSGKASRTASGTAEVSADALSAFQPRRKD